MTVAVGVVLGVLLLVVFWDRQLVLGLLIDAALVALALWQPARLRDLLGT